MTPRWLWDLWISFYDLTFPLQIVSILIHSVYLLVLIRKPLRCHGIFVFMIAICASDILNNFISFPEAANKYKYSDRQWKMHVERSDYPFLVYGWRIVDIPGQLMASCYSITRKYSTWLAVVMSAVRTLAVLFPMNNRIQKINEKTVSVRISIAVFILIMFVDLFDLATTFRIKWFPSIIFNKTVNPEYEFHILANCFDCSTLLQIHISICYRFVPSLIYPILTIILIFQLKTIEKRKANLSKTIISNQFDNKSKMILYLTITFMLSEGINSLVAWVYLFNPHVLFGTDQNFARLWLAMYFATFTVRAIYSLSQVVICAVMSTVYRMELKSVFCGKKLTNVAVVKPYSK